MVKVLALQKFRDLKAGVIRQPNFVFEATQERLEELETNLGSGYVAEVVIVGEKEDDKTDNEVEDYPKHTGGGYYELSNGTKVKGKEVAIEAEKAIR